MTQNINRILIEKIENLKDNQPISAFDIDRCFDLKLSDLLLIYQSNRGYNVSKNMIDKKKEKFDDNFLLVLIEKKQRTVYILPYWELKEFITDAETRPDYKTLYPCRVNKNNTITFGGKIIPSKVVRKYSIQYQHGPLNKEELLKVLKGQQLQEIKKFPYQVLIYIVVAGLLTSSFWSLREILFRVLPFCLNNLIDIGLLTISILALFLNYRRMKNNHSK